MADWPNEESYALQHPFRFTLFWALTLTVPLLVIHFPGARHWYWVGAGVTVVVYLWSDLIDDPWAVLGLMMFWPVMLLAQAFILARAMIRKAQA